MRGLCFVKLLGDNVDVAVDVAFEFDVKNKVDVDVAICSCTKEGPRSQDISLLLVLGQVQCRGRIREAPEGRDWLNGNCNCN
jgi:hypothetical protein